jgi:signal transduction histidine kinase
MSIGTVAARRSEPPAKAPPARPQPTTLDNAQVAALHALLTQIVQYAAAAIADCRCSIQLFERPDAMRTVVASDMPADAIGNAYFPLGVGIAGWVGQTGTPLLAPDVAREPRYVAFGRQVVGAMMCVPLTDGAALYGTMTAWSPKTGGFHRGSFAVLRAIAHGAALAIGQARRAYVQEAAARRAGMLLALTRAVAGCDDPRYAIDLVMPMVADAVPYETAILATLDERDETDVRIFARGPEDLAVQDRQRQWVAAAFAQHHARGNRGPRFTSLTDLVAGHMAFAVLLHAAGTPLGLIAFFHGELFSAEEQQTLQDCSYVIGTAVYNAALYRRLLLGKERFEAVFAYTVDGLLLLDADGTTALDANAAFYELTGIPPADVSFPVPVAALAARWGGGAPALVRDEHADVRRWHIAPDGARELEVTETEIAVGDLPHRLHIFHDVTAARRMERARSEFLSVVSHELRTPLAAMHGFLDLLGQERAGALTRAQREYLDAANQSVRQLWRLIDDINDLVQADLGRLTLRAESVDVGTLVGAVIERMAPQIEGARVRVAVALPESLPPVRADPVRFGQILTNLLANAVKFSEPETTVTLSARVVDGAMEIRVRDTGPGVLPEDRERIFERFVKGTHAPQQDASGLGLGLAVVRQLVTLHGGRVWVESAPGAGSTFIFTLPIA